jgi:hypothetical protein
MWNSASGLANAAVVSRPAARSSDPSQYLLVEPDGTSRWTPNLEAATVFTSMREAMRVAIRLPSAVRAFGLPLTGNGWQAAC